jgi:murein DD-endopeptidase MepM/ murein hydrolase activator NlpD
VKARILLAVILVLVLALPVLAQESWIWPTVGRITQLYHENHHGLDIGAWYGTDVVASKSGTVIWAKTGWAGYGELVVVYHGNGWKTYYSHLSAYAVQEGDKVVQGQKIGEIGSTGRSTGPHLHFEVRWYRQRLDPLNYLP